MRPRVPPRLWNPNAGSGLSVGVLTLALIGRTVYAAGSFTTCGGQPRNNIAAVDAVTGLATAWNPNANGVISDLVTQGGTVYAGGSFTNIGGLARNFIAALDTTTGNATA